MSRTERRLWAVAAVIAVAILATIPLGGVLAESVERPGLAEALFGLGMAIIVAGIVVGAILRTRPLAVPALLVAMGALLGARSLTLAERTHLIEYAALAWVVHAALRHRGLPSGRTAIRAFVLTGGLGIVDELIQAVVPSRVFDPVDIGFNLLAVGGTVLATWLVDRRRPPT